MDKKSSECEFEISYGQFPRWEIGRDPYGELVMTFYKCHLTPLEPALKDRALVTRERHQTIHTVHARVIHDREREARHT